MADENPVRTENPAQGAPGVDQVRPLSDLAKDAEAIDQGAAAPSVGGVPAEVEPPLTTEDVVDILTMARDAAAPAAESAGVLTMQQVQTIWNDDALKRIAKPLLQIVNRHGGGKFSVILDKWGPYGLLLAGVAGPAFATFKALRAPAVEAAPAAAPAKGQGSGQQQPA